MEASSEKELKSPVVSQVSSEEKIQVTSGEEIIDNKVLFTTDLALIKAILSRGVYSKQSIDEFGPRGR